MAEERVQRRLAAILAADVVGYSRLMGVDEVGTRARFNDQLETVVQPAIDEHGGRLVKTMGDGFLVEFGSVVEAVQCAADIQNDIPVRQNDKPDDHKMLLRMGVHMGDVIVEGDDIHGDGVNIASRLEVLANSGGICISASVYEQVRHKLTLSYEDIGEQSLKNIADPVHVYRLITTLEPTASDAKTLSEAMFRRPAVAVLPFENMSGDPEQEYFSDGLTEDIITALSLWRSFPVIARNSTFAYKGQAPDIREVGKQLGARYVVEGSVRKAGSRVRITAQLINAETGHHVWAERYDRELEDIFMLQDEIATRISATLEPAMEHAERARSPSTKTQNVGAWELYQRGMSHIHALTHEDIIEARELFQAALQIDPDYSRGYFGLAFCDHREIYLDATPDRDRSIKNLYTMLNRSIALDDSNPEVHWLMGVAHVWARRYVDAISEQERALELNPSYAAAWSSIGASLNFSGHPDEAVKFHEKYFALNPQDPLRHIHLAFLASAYLNNGDFDKASDTAKKALQTRPNHMESQVINVASLGYLGRIDEAKDIIASWNDISLGELAKRALIQVFDKQEDRNRFVEGLRLAGVPE